MLKPNLKIEIDNSELQVKDLFDAFWAWDGKFIYSVDDLVRRFKMERREMYGLLCTAGKVYAPCSDCLGPVRFFTARKEYREFIRLNGYDWLCSVCRREWKEVQKNNAGLDENRAMRSAFDEGAHETLSEVESEFLLNLAVGKDPVEAGGLVGVSKQDTAKIFEKLFQLNLVRYKDRKVFLIDELKELLIQERSNEKTQRLMTPKTLTLYKELKKKHRYVFPEVPLCAFIKRHAVEHLLKDQPTERFYLATRIDFLICDKFTLPLFAIEYQGGGHTRPAAAWKDDLKRQMLAAAGIPLKVILSDGYVREIRSSVSSAKVQVNQFPLPNKLSIPARIQQTTGVPASSIIYPRTWSKSVNEYVSLLQFRGNKRNILLGKRADFSPDNSVARILFSEIEQPDALPIASVLEIRPGGEQGLTLFYYRKDPDGWKFLFTRDPK